MTTERDAGPVNNETSPAPRERFYRRERQSIPAAREFTRAALEDWGVRKETCDDVLLCVSELATNALLHGVPPGRGFHLRLFPYGDGALRVEVHDSGDGEPRVEWSEGESGRGLLLVSSVADKWGVAERDPGKIVWCEFAPAGRWPPTAPRTA
ncbi:ATP-binding protein [Streptomyces sporangiiformans]|uniref:ATP-binding protein n=1 Tax=Streptomyces sporangiiformans TaxID=2315329 RepID=A0A505DFG3_9ACTN|nr:ATP-binding protein [Streptomyces sporangiiformans]